MYVSAHSCVRDLPSTQCMLRRILSKFIQKFSSPIVSLGVVATTFRHAYDMTCREYNIHIFGSFGNKFGFPQEFIICGRNYYLRISINLFQRISFCSICTLFSKSVLLMQQYSNTYFEIIKIDVIVFTNPTITACQTVVF